MEGEPRFPVKMTAYYGHIDDLERPRRVRWQVIFDIKNPPWLRYPINTPHSEEALYSEDWVRFLSGVWGDGLDYQKKMRSEWDHREDMYGKHEADAL